MCVDIIMDMDKVEVLKKLFFTQLSSAELKNILEVDDTEYNKLLTVVKQELGLRSTYNRRPERFGKYDMDAYFLQLLTPDGFSINGYYNTIDDALKLKDELSTSNKYTEIRVLKATDENLIKLLYADYYSDLNSPELREKYGLPYHKYYKLLEKLRKKYNISHARTNNPHRFIYRSHEDYYIVKQTGGQHNYYGRYEDYESAKKVRDYMEEHDWNHKHWRKNKIEILQKLGVEPPSH